MFESYWVDVCLDLLNFKRMRVIEVSLTYYCNVYIYISYSLWASFIVEVPCVFWMSKLKFIRLVLYFEDSKTELPAQPTHLLLGWNMLAKPFFFRTGRCGGVTVVNLVQTSSQNTGVYSVFQRFWRGEERFQVACRASGTIFPCWMPEPYCPKCQSFELHSICCKRLITDIRGAKGMMMVMMIDGIICRVLSAPEDSSGISTSDCIVQYSNM